VNCRELAEFIIEYLDGELPADVHAYFETHLSACPPCERYLRQYRTTVTAGRIAFKECEGEISPEVPEELIRAILDSRKRLGE
jgi:anti-sigma factor RsiW